MPRRPPTKVSATVGEGGRVSLLAPWAGGFTDTSCLTVLEARSPIRVPAGWFSL